LPPLNPLNLGRVYSIGLKYILLADMRPLSAKRGHF